MNCWHELISLETNLFSLDFGAGNAALSGRQGGWGGAAEGWWPVHLEGLVSRPLWPHSQTT